MCIRDRLNGLGGGASALVAMAEIMDKYGEMAAFNKMTSQLALIVGGLTLSGSLIAAAKLDRRMSQRPVVLTGHNLISNGSIVLMLVLAVLTPVSYTHLAWLQRQRAETCPLKG